MRRIPPAVWILAPLALGLLYALFHGFFAPRPTAAEIAPANAIFTHRFRDLDAVNDGWFRPAADPTPPADLIAGLRNLAGWPGVDRSRPFHLVIVPRDLHQDSTLWVVPVEREESLRARFEDPEFFLDRGHVRHALFLEVRGDFAAIGRDREAVRHIGESGLTAEDLGEDHALAVSVPGVIAHALLTPADHPWRPLLLGLGFDPSAVTPGAGPTVVPAERVVRVGASWQTARLWSWIAEGRIRAELTPAPGAWADQLAAFVPSGGGTDDGLPGAPVRAQAWIRLPNASARALFAHALYRAGVAFPESLGTATEPLGAWGRSEGPGTGGLLLWASPSPGLGHAWTLGLAAPAGSLGDLRPFHPAFPTGPGEADVPEGELELTRADLVRDVNAPAGRILRRSEEGLDLVTAGAAAEDTMARFAAHRARERLGPSAEPATAPDAGWHVVATFGLRRERALTLLGAELDRGGLLRPLAGGDLDGTLSTNGRVLRLDVRVRRLR